MESTPIEQQPTPPADTKTSSLHRHRGKIIGLLTLFFFLIALVLFFYWLIWNRFEEYTDDAYVSGNLVYVTPQVSGIVTAVYAQDSDYVLKDKILIQLDRTDFLIALEKNKAELAENVRTVASLFTTANELEALIEVKKAEFVKNAQDFERRVKLVDSGGVSKEDYDHAASFLSAAYYSLIATEQQYFSIVAQIDNTSLDNHPLIQKAKEKVKDAWIQLKRCTLYAPVNGVVAKRVAQVGERVNPAEPLLAVIPLDQIWVDANFKEVQIGKMQIGQPAKLYADVYGDRIEYHGKIVGIPGGTGSVFSVLPPQNATGNWIKIVQRLPVRIDLDPEEIQKFPLRLGLSMEVTVDIHDIQGPVVAAPRPDKPLFVTEIFQNEEEGVSELIEQIIMQNIPSFFMGPVEDEGP
jgi:membrane fusion protein, multidrug efflux system